MRGLRPKVLVALSLASTVAGCGGGGGGVQEPPTLSALQVVYESVALAANGGLHNVLWSMPAAGMPASCPVPTTVNCSFIVDESSGGLAASPLSAGTQTEHSAWSSLASSLAVPALPVNVDTPAATGDVPADGPTLRAPDVVVKEGHLLLLSEDPTIQKVSYVGDHVRIDRLASDGATVATSETITAMNVVDVSGTTVGGLRSEIAGWLNKHRLVSNAALLDAGAAFGPGAAWVKSSRSRLGDTLFAGDCSLAQTSTTPAGLVPCKTATTLSALTTINSYYDGVGGATRTYTLASDGALCELVAQAAGTCPKFGVRYWMSRTPRDPGANVPAATETYRAFFEANGNVYSGNVQKDGATLRTNVGSDAAPSIQPFVIRVNKPFVDSLKAALTF